MQQLNPKMRQQMNFPIVAVGDNIKGWNLFFDYLNDNNERRSVHVRISEQKLVKEAIS